MLAEDYLPGKKKFTRHKKIVIPLFLSLISAIVLLLPMQKGITITDYKTGHMLYCHSAVKGDIFSLHYIHSVNKSPVEDFFIIGNNDELVLEKTVFRSFGAGVPSSPEDGGVLKVYKDRVEVTGINRRIDKLLLFVGVTAEHRFRMDNDEFLLRLISGPQRNLMISMERFSLLDNITHRHHK